jgi:CRISPR-associated exonuclease Cas4
VEITGTLMSYYFYCHRRLWLHANGIQLEDNSEDVGLGVLIEENAYKQRSERYKQIEIGSIKIDFYDTQNKIIHEVKKSQKFHDTHIWQLRYYIFILEKSGIVGVTGVLEYPAVRKKEKVVLNDIDREELVFHLKSIEEIINSKSCPGKINSVKCKRCSYYDFCYSQEPE